MSGQVLQELSDRIVEYLVEAGLEPSEEEHGPHAFRFGSTLVMVSAFEHEGLAYARFAAVVLRDFRPNLEILTRLIRLNTEVLFGAFVVFEDASLCFTVSLPGEGLGLEVFRRTLLYVARVADDYDEELQAVAGGDLAGELLDLDGASPGRAPDEQEPAAGDSTGGARGWEGPVEREQD